MGGCCRAIVLFVLFTLFSFTHDAHMEGVGTASSYIERFNDGNPPRGITPDDTYDESLIEEKKPYIQREVRVEGNDALKVYLYLNPVDESIVFVRLDETLAADDTDSVLPDMNTYLYTTFFPDAEEENASCVKTNIQKMCDDANTNATITVQQGYFAGYSCYMVSSAKMFRSLIYAMSGSASSHFNLTGYLYD